MSLAVSEASGVGRRSWPRRGAVVLILAAHLGLLLYTAREKSVTSDEPFHIARGVSALCSGDFRMSVAHPPLANLICALPLLGLHDLQIPYQEPAWQSPKVDSAERKFIFAGLLLWVRDLPNWRGNSDPLLIIFLCRLPVMAMSLGLGLLVYAWSARMFGPRAGLAGLILYCFSPTVLAHSELVTTDTASALFMFIFAIGLAWHLDRPSWKRLMVCGAALGLAQLVKYTAILLLPCLPVVLILSGPGPWRDRVRKFLVLDPRRPEFLTGAGGLAVMLALTAAVIWAGFGFEVHSFHTLSAPDPVPLAWSGAWLKYVCIKLMAWVPIPPRTYYYGLARTLTNTEAHSHPLYFLGRVSEQGWWYYYPVLFVIKEPLAFLGLLLLSLAAIKQPPAWPRASLLVTVVFIAGIGVFFMFLNQKNIGLRHLLPIYPLLCVWLGRTVEVKAGSGRFKPAAWALVAVHAANGFLACPDYLVHFNRLVGGPEGGLHYSVVGEDWGQDVAALGKYCRQNGIASVYYNPYGNVDAAAYGVPRQKFSCATQDPGWYAFHVIDLYRPKNDEPPDCYDRFLALKPTAVLHHTIYVYHWAPGSP